MQVPLKSTLSESDFDHASSVGEINIKKEARENKKTSVEFEIGSQSFKSSDCLPSSSLASVGCMFYTVKHPEN